MNLANKITFFRFILVPVYVFFVGYTDLYTVAFIVFLIASITDFLDGHIARKYNMITNLGKFIDPLADKFLTLSAFIIFATKFSYISPIVLMVVVFRELTISVFRAVASSNNNVIAASIFGKVKTIIQITLVIILNMSLIITIPKLIIDVLTVLMVLVTLISLFEYIVKNIEVLKK